jgi:hypothetical protein
METIAKSLLRKKMSSTDSKTQYNMKVDDESTPPYVLLLLWLFRGVLGVLVGVESRLFAAAR